VTLSLHIARRFALTFIGVLAVFFGLVALIDMVEQIRRHSGDGLTFGGALGLAALNTPATIYQILPLIAILASVALFLGLARTSELIVVRAAGRSAVRLLMAPMITAALIGAITVAVLNPIVAGTTQRYEMLSSRFDQDAGSVLSIGSEGLWLRESVQGQKVVIHSARTNPDGTELFDATFMIFGADGRPLERISADRAELRPGAWRLTGVKHWNLAVTNPERGAVQVDQLSRASNLTRERIRESFGAPATTSIWELPAFIRRLEEAGFSARSHRVWMQMELALPLMMAAMVLLGAGLAMRHTRLGSTGRRVMLALLAGFGVYYLRNFAQLLGESGQISIALAAWSPPAAGLMLGFGLLLHLEDG
jgi:lipopolysaccharide export system permease protein